MTIAHIRARYMALMNLAFARGRDDIALKLMFRGSREIRFTLENDMRR